MCLAVVAAYLAPAHRTGTSFDWSLFSSTLSGLDWGWLALSALLALTTYLGRALRWAVFLKPLRPRPNLWNLLKATVIGFTALSLVGRPGEFVRPYLIAVKEQVPVSSQLAAWFLERIFDLLFALLIFGWGLSRVRASDARLGPALEWVFQTGGTIVWVASVAICLALLFLRQHLDVAGRRLVESLGFLPERYLAKANVLAGAFVQGLESIRSTKAALTLVGYTIFEWALIAGCYVCLVRSFGNLHLSLVDVLILMGFVTFGAVVQLPGVGGGIQVVTVLVLRELFGVPVEIASSVALVVWVIGSILIVPFGVVLAIHEGLNWSKLKTLRAEASL